MLVPYPQANAQSLGITGGAGWRTRKNGVNGLGSNLGKGDRKRYRHRCLTCGNVTPHLWNRKFVLADLVNLPVILRSSDRPRRIRYHQPDFHSRGVAVRRFRLTADDREIGRLAVPAFLALVAEPLFLLGDAAVVGHLGTRELAGLGIAGTVLQTLVGLCVFLAYGTTAGVARQLGAGRRDAALAQGVDGLWLAVVIGIPTTVAGILLTGPMVAALGPGAAVARRGGDLPPRRPARRHAAPPHAGGDRGAARSPGHPDAAGRRRGRQRGQPAAQRGPGLRRRAGAPPRHRRLRARVGARPGRLRRGARARGRPRPRAARARRSAPTHPGSARRPAPAYPCSSGPSPCAPRCW